MNITFEILGEPRPKKRPRAKVRRMGARVFADAYTPRETIEDEQTFVSRAYEHRPAAPLAGPLLVELTFVFGVAASWSERKKAEALSGLTRNVNAKDIDNLAKLSIDAMNGVFWIDDRQICELIARKAYGEVPRTVVRILELAASEYGRTA